MEQQASKTSYTSHILQYYTFISVYFEINGMEEVASQEGCNITLSGMTLPHRGKNPAHLLFSYMQPCYMRIPLPLNENNPSESQ